MRRHTEDKRSRFKPDSLRARTKGEAGFTLLELLVVLGILSGLLVTIYGYIAVTQRTSRINQAIQDVQIIRGAGGNWSAGRPTHYTGIGTTAIAYLLPRRLIGAGGVAGVGVNPWAGNYTVAATSGDVTTLSITVTAVPQAEGDALKSRLDAPGPDVATFTVEANKTEGTLTVVY